jgi:hypothetical protein
VEEGVALPLKKLLPDRDTEMLCVFFFGEAVILGLELNDGDTLELDESDDEGEQEALSDAFGLFELRRLARSDREARTLWLMNKVTAGVEEGLTLAEKRVSLEVEDAPKETLTE